MSVYSGRSRLRAYIAERNPDLSILLDYLWSTSLSLHNDQNKANGTENGKRHVEAVEDNIWRLMNGAEGISISDFKDDELCVLSACACCHDYDKALRKYDADSFPHKFVHGSGSADFIVENYTLIGFVNREDLAHRVSEICRIHALKGGAFEQELDKLAVDQVTSKGPINVYKMAVILKAADILHTDKSRTHTIGFKPKKLVGTDRSTYFARNCIEGWKINGRDIIIEAKYQTPEEHKALRACKKCMEKDEWPCVGKFLKAFGFPHKLNLDITRKSQGVAIMASKPFIKANRWRNFGIRLTNAVLALVTKFSKKSICRNQYASHAVGSALSWLAARSLREKVDSLKSAFESFVDLSWEEDFSFDKLQEHIIFLSDLCSRLKQLLDEPARRPGEIDNSEQHKDQKANILNDILRMLPGAKEVMNDALPGIRDDLTREINKLNVVLVKVASKIDSLPRKERKQARQDRKRYRSIKKAMLEFFPVLANMKNAVGESADNLRAVVDRAREDWANDIGDLSLDGDCVTG